jgi:apolipoprotein N-acyltransferase
MIMGDNRKERVLWQTLCLGSICAPAVLVWLFMLKIPFKVQVLLSAPSLTLILLVIMACLPFLVALWCRPAAFAPVDNR